MKIRDIKLLNFRNYDNLELEFSENINIIIGNNGEGKTNILESIYVLSLTKSNRNGLDTDLIQFNKKNFKLEGNVIDDEMLKKYSVSYIKNNKTVSINGKDIKKITDYISNFCVISFSPVDLEIIKGAPSVRRNFLNIEVSQLYNKYINYLNEYNYILKMRNDYLKKLNLNSNIDKRYLDIINEKIIEKALKIYEYRFIFLEEINSFIESIFFKLTGKRNLKVLYENSLGIEKYDAEFIKKSLISKFEKNYYQELMLGNTLVGPHRDDFKFDLNGMDMKLYSSQGQQRLAIISFKLAELYIFKRIKKSYPVLLLDDIFSEIDIKKRNKIIKYLNNDIQTIITTTDIEDISEDLLKKARIFKIRNGKITIRGEINGRKNRRKL